MLFIGMVWVKSHMNTYKMASSPKSNFTLHGPTSLALKGSYALVAHFLHMSKYFMRLLSSSSSSSLHSVQALEGTVFTSNSLIGVWGAHHHLK